MKLILAFLLTLSTLLHSVPEAGTAAGISHPRILVSEDDFARIEHKLSSGKSVPDTVFRAMHASQIARADKYVKAADMPVYKKDQSGKRILSVCRNALSQIFACAYAYRTTGDVKYLNHTVAVMRTVCSFPDWNPSHFLDVAEMGLAVSIGYDWLYDSIDEKTRSMAVRAMHDFSMIPALSGTHDTWYLKSGNNWNQVCNAGTAAVAIALADIYPDESDRILKQALPSILSAVSKMYAPDGVYPEGVGYWQYGTDFQIVMSTLLQRVYGNDFGISDIAGFSHTGDYFMFAQGNLGRRFDYADNGESADSFREGWYFACRFNNPSSLSLFFRKYFETKKISSSDRLSPLFLIYASRFNGAEVKAPSKRLFCGGGEVPVLMARTGWGREDIYLGIKGGRASYNHGHMDAGSFIYEKDGVRWASEVHSGCGYAPLEKAMKQVPGGNLWRMSQDSKRWAVFSYGCREHNTLTVNNHNHIVAAKAEFVDVSDSPDLLGGTLDMTPVFGGELANAKRRIEIVDGTYLRITDELTAPVGANADVRFTFVTDAATTIGRNGINLSCGGKSARLSVKGAKVQFRRWTFNEKDYPLSVNEAVHKPEKEICGYTYTVPAGRTISVVTILK